MPSLSIVTLAKSMQIEDYGGGPRGTSDVVPSVPRGEMAAGMMCHTQMIRRMGGVMDVESNGAKGDGVENLRVTHVCSSFMRGVINSSLWN